jgi:hypothetical protein
MNIVGAGKARSLDQIVKRWTLGLCAAFLLGGSIAGIGAWGAAHSSSRPSRADAGEHAAAPASVPAPVSLADTWTTYVYIASSSEQAAEFKELGPLLVAGEVRVAASSDQETAIRDSIAEQRGPRAAAGLPEVEIVDLRAPAP